MFALSLQGHASAQLDSTSSRQGADPAAQALLTPRQDLPHGLAHVVCGLHAIEPLARVGQPARMEPRMIPDQGVVSLGISACDQREPVFTACVPACAAAETSERLLLGVLMQRHVTCSHAAS